MACRRVHNVRCWFSLAAALLVLVGYLQMLLYFYTRLFLCPLIPHVHCWLLSGAGSVILGASAIFLFWGLDRRPPWWMVVGHFGSMAILQVVCLLMCELLEWRQWIDRHKCVSLEVQRTIRACVLCVGVFGVSVASSTVLAALVRMCCAMEQQTSGQRLNDISGLSCDSWEFIRIRSALHAPKPPETFSHMQQIPKGRRRRSGGGVKRRRVSIIGHFDTIRHAYSPTEQKTEPDPEVIEELLKERHSSRQLLALITKDKHHASTTPPTSMTTFANATDSPTFGGAEQIVTSETPIGRLRRTETTTLYNTPEDLVHVL